MITFRIQCKLIEFFDNFKEPAGNLAEAEEFKTDLPPGVCPIDSFLIFTFSFISLAGCVAG